MALAWNQWIDLFVILVIGGAGFVAMVFGWDHMDQCTNNLPLALVIASVAIMGVSIYFCYRILYENRGILDYKPPDLLWTLLFMIVLGFLAWEYNGTASDSCSTDVYTYSLFVIIGISVVVGVSLLYVVIVKYLLPHCKK